MLKTLTRVDELFKKKNSYCSGQLISQLINIIYNVIYSFMCCVLHTPVTDTKQVSVTGVWPHLHPGAPAAYCWRMTTQAQVFIFGYFILYYKHVYFFFMYFYLPHHTGP